METKRGAELVPGDIFKHNEGQRRIYQVVEITREEDHDDSRFGTFRTTSLELVDFYVFDDTVYEMRDVLRVRNQPRMIKVRAEDVLRVLGRVMTTDHTGKEDLDAIGRLKEAAS